MRKNYIYGIGILGKLLFYELRDKKIKIDGIIVSDGYKNSEEFIETKIYELKEINRDEKINIYITVLTNKKAIFEKLKKFENFNIIDFTKLEELENFKNEYLKRVILKNYKIDEKFLEFNEEFKIINPFKIPGEYQYSFWNEFNDLILPSCNNDFTEIDEGPYEYKEIFLEKDDVVIDAGANIGLFSNYAASKECKVYAFEPNLDTVKILEENAKCYEGDIEVLSNALSNKNECIQFYISEENTNCGILNRENNKNYINVKGITIDSFVKENNIKKIDFIKADIEGAERFMLEGAKETLKNFAPKLAICTYHLEDDCEVLENLIKKYNDKYIVIHKWKKLFAYIPEH